MNHTPADALPCRTADPELWFGETLDARRQAAAGCLGCPVRTACLRAAIDRAEPWGVWGGEWFAGEPVDLDHGLQLWATDPRELVTEAELAELLGITPRQLTKRLTEGRTRRRAGDATGRELPEPDYPGRGPGQNVGTAPPHRWALDTLQPYLAGRQVAPEAREAA